MEGTRMDLIRGIIAAPVLPMKFSGTAVETKTGEKTGLQMSLTKNDKGYAAQIKVSNADGSGGTQVVNFVQTGNKFVYDGMVGGEQLHIEMTFGANNTSIGGTWKAKHQDGSYGSGTFSLKRV